MSRRPLSDNLTLPEIFEQVRAEESLESKVEVLLMYNRADLRWFVDIMYNGNFEDVIVPSFEPSKLPIGATYTSLRKGYKTIDSIFKERFSPKAEARLRTALECLHATEADLIVNLLSGKKVEGISKAVFKRAYPRFFSESDSEAV